jgi:hypothetical protein
MAVPRHAIVETLTALMTVPYSGHSWTRPATTRQVSKRTEYTENTHKMGKETESAEAWHGLSKNAPRVCLRPTQQLSKYGRAPSATRRQI